jgi:hypothetical protein
MDIYQREILALLEEFIFYFKLNCIFIPSTLLSYE